MVLGDFSLVRALLQGPTCRDPEVARATGPSEGTGPLITPVANRGLTFLDALCSASPRGDKMVMSMNS